jgi:hypothetical protein
LTTEKQAFGVYLKRAVDRALKDELDETDNGNLQWFAELARRGVRKNWTDLTPQGFLEQLLWCIGSIRKKYWVHEKHFPGQMVLLRQCKPADILRDADKIRTEWVAKKCDLNMKMLEAVIGTATKVAAGWDAFKVEYLPLPG